MKRLSREQYLERAHSMARRGCALPHAKLDEAKVMRLRSEYVPNSRTHGAPALAKRYGVHQRTVERALSCENWSHVRVAT